MLHKQCKHIDVRYYFIRERYIRREIDVIYIPSESQLADILTKPIVKNRFLTLCRQINVDEIDRSTQIGRIVD